MKCRYEHDGDCCNSGAAQYMCKCKKPCDTIFPVTNADRIRAMTDEELCQVVSKSYVCSYVRDDSLILCDSMPDCGTCALHWLKQPAKEEV